MSGKGSDDEIEDWLPVLVGEEMSFLETEYGFTATGAEPLFGEVLQRYTNRNVAFEIRLNYLEGILSTPLIVAPQKVGQPDVILELNMILEARGRRDLRITQDDVGTELDRNQARVLIHRVAENLQAYAGDVLGGDLSVVSNVRRLMKGVPGDPRFDWWLVEPDNAS